MRPAGAADCHGDVPDLGDNPADANKGSFNSADFSVPDLGDNPADASARGGLRGPLGRAVAADKPSGQTPARSR